MFANRREAGELLARQLQKYKGKKNALVLGIPRGGIVVAYQIATALRLPLDVIVIRKLGAPGNEELAIGATGVHSYILNQEVLDSVPVRQDYIQDLVREKQEEVKRYSALLRGRRKMYTVTNKIVILVDDGVATGSTMMMAIQLIRTHKPKKIIVAVPVGPSETISQLQKLADEVVCLSQPEAFFAIGGFYRDFAQVEDETAIRLLKEASKTS